MFHIRQAERGVRAEATASEVRSKELVNASAPL